MAEVAKFPFGKASKQTVAAVANTAVTIDNTETILDLGVMAQDTTVNLTLPTDLPVGANLAIKAASDGTARNLIMGTGLQGLTVAGVISKTKIINAKYDGVNFVVLSSIQVN